MNETILIQTGELYRCDGVCIAADLSLHVVVSVDRRCRYAELVDFADPAGIAALFSVYVEHAKARSEKPVTFCEFAEALEDAADEYVDRHGAEIARPVDGYDDDQGYDG